MPFGRLVKESLESGLNTLFDIKDLVLALYEAKQALTNVLGKFFLLFKATITDRIEMTIYGS